MKVLIVDDNEPFINQTKRMLVAKATEGALPCEPEDLLFAITNADAQDVLHNQKIDLVFLDLRMDQGHSGFSLLPILEEQGCDFIVITGVDDANARAEAERRGAIGFFKKPVQYDQLMDAIRMYERMARRQSIHSKETWTAGIVVTILFLAVVVIVALVADNDLVLIPCLLIWGFFFGAVNGWWGQRTSELFARLLSSIKFWSKGA